MPTNRRRTSRLRRQRGSRRLPTGTRAQRAAVFLQPSGMRRVASVFGGRDADPARAARRHPRV